MAVNWGLANDGQFDYLQSLQAIGNSQAQKLNTQRGQYAFDQQRTQDTARPGLFAQAQGGDFAGAGNAALANNDLDAFKVIGGLREDQRQQVKAHSQLIGGFAASLSQLPEGPARMAAFKAAAPQLLKQGFTPDELAQADLSDNGLRGYIAAAGATDNALEAYYKSQQPLTVADGTQVYGATPMGGGARPLLAENQKEPPKADYVYDSDRGVFIQKPGTGGLAATGAIMPSGVPGGGGQASGGSGRTAYGWTPRARNGGDNPDNVVDNKISGMATALGIGPDDDLSKFSPRAIAGALALSEGGKGSLADRNNNPGNLTDPKTGQFRKFATKEAGLAAAAEQVQRNLRRGQTSIRTMVEGLPVGGGQDRAPSGGGMVIPTGLPPKDKNYRILTPQEARDRGLDENSRWQVGPNNQVTSLPSKGDKPLTESQGKATGYLERAVAAADALNSIPRAPKPSEANAALYMLDTRNPLRRNISPEAQRALSAQEAFVLAILRQDSGAAINKDEVASAMRIYFPQPGDNAQTQADKRRQREAAIRGLRTTAGPGADTVRGSVAPGAGARGPVRVLKIERVK